MSIINSDGLNTNWQLNVLKGLQCICDELKEINIDTDDLEKLLKDLIVELSAGIDTNITNGPLGDAVNIQDGGNSITVDAIGLDVRQLNCDDKVSVCFNDGVDDVTVSSTNPLPVNASISFPPSLAVTQDPSSNPWTVDATDLDVRDLTFATDSVDVSGSSVDANITGPLGGQDCDDSLAVTLCSAQAQNLLEIKNAVEGTLDVNVVNPVTTLTLEGLADIGNSSTTPLAAGATFTGVAIDIKDYSAINVAAFSDVSAATGGLRMEFSPDGINWDHAHTFNVTGNIGVSYAQAVELRYFRIVYINGVTAQASFRLTTILKATTVSPSRYTVEQPLAGNQMADVVKSVIFGKSSAGGGTYVDVKVDPSGSLETNVKQTTHDDLNANVNIQVGDTDVSSSNPVPVSLTSQIRTHNTIVATTGPTAINSVPSGSLRGSVINVGNAPGIWNGISLPAGISLPWDPVGNRDTYGAIPYDATGTTFIIEYTT